MLSLRTFAQRFVAVGSETTRTRLCRAFTSSTSTSTVQGGAKVAIVGSGPSGCYTAKYLQIALKDDPPSMIHVLEKLPTPFGLVRSGVAPDHPEVKNVQNDFSQLFQAENVQLLANVKVGSDVSLEELRQLYDVVVLAYGCESDRKLGIPGEDSIEGILSAREFVAWYNGHPDFVYIGEQVKKALGEHVTEARVAIIGQGNVALDCARILAKGSSQLVDTDIASHALEVLKEGVRITTVLGRRGHVQGAFTIKELRELTKLENASFVVQEAELQLGSTAASLAELESAKPKQRIDSLLREAAAKAPTDEKQVHLRFLLNPSRFEATENGSSLGAVICERTMLQGDAASQSAVGTGEYETVTANLALVSIGYKGVAIPGVEEFFDARRGVVRNAHGKVESGSATHGGLYVSGWLKRGPSGIIGTNISDAKDTVASIVKDWNASNEPIRDDYGCLLSLLQNRGVRVVDWKSYQKIEEAESDPRRKRSAEQPRQKISNHDELVKIALCHT
jgi:adrenodoxin-NADP+ reductase